LPAEWKRCLKRPSRLPRSAPQTAPRDRKLLDAAERLFLRKGYHATTMDDVAAAAAVSKKTIYQAFASKEALFRALVQARRAPIFTPVPIDGPAEQVLTNALRTAVEFILSPKEVAVFRLVAAEGAATPALAQAFYDEGSKQGQFAVEACLAALAKRGDIEIDDPLEAAHMLLGMALGIIHIALLLGVRRSPTKSEVEQLVQKAVHVFLSGTTRAGRTQQKR
jgi:TetR/AcrR family transcriptional regulator, mexJK operon transcriptional repressor